MFVALRPLVKQHNGYSSYELSLLNSTHVRQVSRGHPGWAMVKKNLDQLRLGDGKCNYMPVPETLSLIRG